MPQPVITRVRVRDSDDQASLFLRKAYHLVSNCPPSLGGWTVNGDSFLVKDSKLFSENVIPTVYKHNNFSSFVRQLNFYGFRKIKSDLSTSDNPCWEFRHPKFIRGMPHLLSGIKRAVHHVLQTEASAARENNFLKSSIKELAEKLSAIDNSFVMLTHLLKTFVKSSDHPMTAEATHFLEGIERMCGTKRRAGAMDGLNDFDRDETKSKSAEVSDKDFRIPYYDHINDGEYSDDADSVSDVVTQCSEDKETPDHHDEADFDDFIAYIAHDESGRDTTPSVSSLLSSPLHVSNDRKISCVRRDRDCL